MLMSISHWNEYLIAAALIYKRNEEIKKEKEKDSEVNKQKPTTTTILFWFKERKQF